MFRPSCKMMNANVSTRSNKTFSSNCLLGKTMFDRLGGVLTTAE